MKRHPNQTATAITQPTPACHCQARRTTRCEDIHTGLSTGPPDRAAPRKHGPKMGNGIRLTPPLQNLSRPRPATAGPGGQRAARTLLRAGHPALCRVPVTLHRSCTPELGTSCDVAVHSNNATRTAPDQMSRQETRIRRPGRTPPGPDAAQTGRVTLMNSAASPVKGMTHQPNQNTLAARAGRPVPSVPDRGPAPRLGPRNESVHELQIEHSTGLETAR